MKIFMEFIPIFIICLFHFSVANTREYSISSNSSTGNRATELCKLASPCINFEKDKEKIDVGKFKIDYPSWIGFTKAFGAFAFKGCYSVADSQYTGSTDEIRPDLGYCFSYCKMTKNVLLFGIQFDRKHKCHCFTTLPTTMVEMCTSLQEHDFPFLVGRSSNSVAIYKAVNLPAISDDNENLYEGDRRCLAYEPGNGYLLWLNCFKNYKVICRGDQGNFEFNTSTAFAHWANSMMNCFRNNYRAVDLTDNLSSIQGPGSQLWLGIIRHLAIYRTPESFQGIINVTQGYVETNKELTFATGSVQRQGLCENNSTTYSCYVLPLPPVQHMTTTTSKTTLSNVESKVQKSSRAQSPVTQPDVRSEIIRTPKQRKDSTKQNQNDESTTVKIAFQESEDGKAKSAAVYAVIPVVIVLIAVGVMVFYLWRRKSLTKEKDDIIQPNVTVHDRQTSVHNVNISAENPVGNDYLEPVPPVSEYSTIRESKIDKCQEEDYDTTLSRDDYKNKSHNIYNYLENEETYDHTGAMFSNEPEETYDHPGAKFSNEPEEMYDHTGARFTNEEDTYNHAVLPHTEELYDKTGESQGVHNDHEDQYSHIGKTAQNSYSQTNINPILVSSEIDDTYNHVQR